MFPDVSLWTCEPGAAWGAIWWPACCIFPLFLWFVTGCCDQWWSRTWWRPSRSPPRTSYWWGRSPQPWLLLCTLRGSASASNRHQQLKTHTHTHFFALMYVASQTVVLGCCTLNLGSPAKLNSKKTLKSMVKVMFFLLEESSRFNGSSLVTVTAQKDLKQWR